VSQAVVVEDFSVVEAEEQVEYYFYQDSLYL
jgi:hypothetical protein